MKNCNKLVKSTIGTLVSAGASIGVADAAIVMSPTVGSGLRPPSTTGTFITWDVDNDGTPDFNLYNSSYYTAVVVTAWLTGLNGARVQQTALNNALLNLTASQIVGPSANIDWVYLRGSTNGVLLTEGSEFSDGVPGYMGFQFMNGGSSTYYGIAEITFGNSTPGEGIYITKAWYNDTPDGTISPNQVPEPENMAVGLAALALGAASLMRWRKRKAQA